MPVAAPTRSALALVSTRSEATVTTEPNEKPSSISGITIAAYDIGRVTPSRISPVEPTDKPSSRTFRCPHRPISRAV